jgi:hypothetical protein
MPPSGLALALDGIPASLRPRGPGAPRKAEQPGNVSQREQEGFLGATEVSEVLPAEILSQKGSSIHHAVRST